MSGREQVAQVRTLSLHVEKFSLECCTTILQMEGAVESRGEHQEDTRTTMHHALFLVQNTFYKILQINNGY